MCVLCTSRSPDDSSKSRDHRKSRGQPSCACKPSGIHSVRVRLFNHSHRVCDSFQGTACHFKKSRLPGTAERIPARTPLFSQYQQAGTPCEPSGLRSKNCRLIVPGILLPAPRRNFKNYHCIEHRHKKSVDTRILQPKFCTRAVHKCTTAEQKVPRRSFVLSVPGESATSSAPPSSALYQREVGIRPRQSGVWLRRCYRLAHGLH